MVLNQRTFDRCVAIIREYNLHKTMPVDLSAMLDLFPVRRDDIKITGAQGLIIPPRLGWPAYEGNPARVVIDKSVRACKDVRLIYAHEIGHGICEHLGFAMRGDRGLDIKHEREAWQAASMLLIPPRVVYEEKEVQRVAATCKVPQWLVHLLPLDFNEAGHRYGYQQADIEEWRDPLASGDTAARSCHWQAAPHHYRNVAAEKAGAA